MNQAFYLLAATEPETYERLFGLDPQLIFDSLITGLSVFILFFVLSYLLFNPARDMLKKRQDLEALHQRLMGELQQESDKNNIQLRDSINAYLKEYNKDKKYSLIINNAGFNNLLYADPAFNITQEVIDGLNKRYVPAKSE